MNDPESLERQPVLALAIRGAGGARVGDNPRFAEWAREVGAESIWPGRALCGSRLVRGACAEVRRFYEACPTGRIILLGYSVGGHEAVALANLLGPGGVSIHAMITFDPHRKNCFGYKDYVLTGGNVRRAVNFYQRNQLQLLTGRNPFRGSPVQGARNVDLTGAPVDHVSIVTYSLQHHADLIEEALNL